VSVCLISNRFVQRLVTWSTRILLIANMITGTSFSIVYDNGNGKEALRLARDFQDSDIPEDFKPDDVMISASSRAAQHYLSSMVMATSDHGPSLIMPELTCAFRFSYRTLIAVNADNAYLWGVPVWLTRLATHRYRIRMGLYGASSASAWTRSAFSYVGPASYAFLQWRERLWSNA
jgi:hypothetical protein